MTAFNVLEVENLVALFLHLGDHLACATVYTQVSLQSRKILKVLVDMENPILIHAKQIDGQAFGDPRLVKRGRHCTMPSINIRR
jgi:hypothetical protein